MKPFVKNLCCEVLKRSVLVICGGRSEARPLFDRMASRYMSKKLRDETWADVCGAWDKAREESPGCRAITMSCHGDVYVVMPEWSLPVFAHEAYHAAQAVLRHVGTDDEELGAYLVEWMVGSVAETARKANKEK